MYKRQAMACAERVRKAVNATHSAVGHLSLRGSISIGVAVRDAAMADVNALIKQADRGMYVAKQRGRNHVATLQTL